MHLQEFSVRADESNWERGQQKWHQRFGKDEEKHFIEKNRIEAGVQAATYWVYHNNRVVRCKRPIKIKSNKIK